MSPTLRRLLCVGAAGRLTGPGESAARAIPASLYDYSLPEDRIATEPAHPRDSSKLLVHNLTNNETWTPVRHSFRDLPDILPSNVTIVMNQSRVIPARIPRAFKTRTGGAAEIFLLQPADGSDPAVALSDTTNPQNAVWDCLVRGRNLRAGEELVVQGTPSLHGVLLEKGSDHNSNTRKVRLRWQPVSSSLADILASLGSTPLPPYIRRPCTPADITDYQTVYAKSAGSVAAPTAGLHFTDETMAKCLSGDRKAAWVTLHVGAGTFIPIKEGTNAGEHRMHAERVTVTFEDLRSVAEAKENNRPVLLVGTTSTRVMESVYWHGVGLLLGRWSTSLMNLGQWDAYSLSDELATNGLPHPSIRQSFEAAIAAAKGTGKNALEGSTQLMIVPGYRFRITDALLTNLHQPRSTLLLLVAALTGSRESLIRMYDRALLSNMRFLSYGDSSLLAPRSFLPDRKNDE